MTEVMSKLSTIVRCPDSCVGDHATRSVRAKRDDLALEKARSRGRKRGQRNARVL